MSGWTLGKYVLALLGVALVLLADRVNVAWPGYAGLAFIVAAFVLRFVQRRAARARGGGPPG